MFSEIDFVKLGRRVRAARKEGGMTQEELAVLCGCTRNHLSAVETGENRPSLELLVRLAAVLHTGVDHFLMDSPLAAPQYVIQEEIAPKLAKCTAGELAFINHTIDALFAYRETLLSSEKSET